MPNFEQLISVDDLTALLGSDDVRVVDCRFSLLESSKGHADYAAGHIPSAVYAHLDDDLAAPETSASGRHPLPSADDFVATLRRWGISNDTQVVVYDDASGGLAARLWWMLRWLGHSRVALLDGGFAAWREADGPISVDTPEPAPGSFVGQPDDGMTIDVRELEQRLAADGSFLLVDARDAARFRGEVEPIDNVAGHVPGSRNLPFSDYLDGAGRWLAADALATAWEPLPVSDRAREWAVMCGSGVTACHLALSAAVLGLPEPRLFAGSWSEWIRDPGRSVATGPDEDAAP